ncbi:MAG: phosphotransferase [Candidatus Coatesbacteria bacterium]
MGKVRSARVFPTQSSVLDSQALGRMVLSSYGVSGPITCRFFRKGMTDAYEVKSPTSTYFLKIYMHGRRSWADVEDEVHFLNYLHRHRVPVVGLVRRSDGAFITRLNAAEGTRHAVLFRSAPGRDPDCGQPGFCVSLGRLIGRLHKVADGIQRTYQRAPADLDFLIDRQIETVRPFMAHRRDDFELVSAIGASVKRRIAELLSRAKPEYGICHGDLHGTDVRVDGKGGLTLFDFDSFACGWRAVEIGVFYATHEWMNVTPQAEAERMRQLGAFLRGYQRERKLSRGELEAIKLGPAVRHIYLMGIVLKHSSAYNGFHWANDHFFDWHMKWFRHWAKHGPLVKTSGNGGRMWRSR